MPRTSSLVATTSYSQPNQSVIEIRDTKGAKRNAEGRGKAGKGAKVINDETR